MKELAVFVKNKSTAMLIGKVGFCFVVQLGLVRFESYTKIITPKRKRLLLYAVKGKVET